MATLSIFCVFHFVLCKILSWFMASRYGCILFSFSCLLLRHGTRVGNTKAQFGSFSIMRRFDSAKVYVSNSNHVHKCQVSPQLSCGNTCQIWICYYTGYQSFIHLKGRKINLETPTLVDYFSVFFGAISATTKQMYDSPVPMRQSWRIGVNRSYQPR